MLKKAMIMAAGVGSRLGALSDMLPKPIVPLANVPAMDIIVKHLASFGINEIIANTYYKADDIKNHYENFKGINFNFVKEAELSGTAGGVKKCQSFFDKGNDFIVMSGDGLSDINIEKAYESHTKSGAIATIVLKEVEYAQVQMYGIVVPDKDGLVESFQEKPHKNEAKSNLANTGIYIFNYKIFDYIPENMFYDFAKNVFPSLMKNNEKINTFKMEGYWSDVGSIEQYKQSNFDIINGKINYFKPEAVKSLSGKYVSADNFKMGENVSIVGNCVFGSNCRLCDNSKIINSVIWDNVTVEEGVVIENSIVLSNSIIDKNIKNAVISPQKAEVTV